MPSTAIDIRPATSADLPAIGDIYNYYVLHSTCTFDTEPRPADRWTEWLAEHGPDTPAIVAITDGQLIGWGSLSRWTNRCAYRFSVENSVYVRHDCHRRGVGRALLMELVSLARQHGHRSIIAQISDDQTPSKLLHAALGFKQVGCLEQIGYKFDRWIDVAIWQLRFPP